MLIGILPPTKNTARMLGYDILNEIELARRYIGVVPQFDILWEDLTVSQNMEIF
jgi:ABC-type multidrug transport system ATPase subunit